MPDDDHAVCSTKVAADLLGVSPSTIQRMVEDGILDGWKTSGGHRRIRRSSIQDILKKNSTGRQNNRLLNILMIGTRTDQTQIISSCIENCKLPALVSQHSNTISALIAINPDLPSIMILEYGNHGVGLNDLCKHIDLHNIAHSQKMILLIISPAPEEQLRPWISDSPWVSILGEPVQTDALKHQLQLACTYLL